MKVKPVCACVAVVTNKQTQILMNFYILSFNT